jgi:hypothetical protein
MAHGADNYLLTYLLTCTYFYLLTYLLTYLLLPTYQLTVQPFVGLGFLRQQPCRKIGSGFTYKYYLPIHHLPVGSDWSSAAML